MALRQTAVALIVLLIMTTLLVSLQVPTATSFWSGEASWSPSFLLLSNWVNSSVLVQTGVPIANATLNGLTNRPFRLTNLYVGPYGIIPFTLELQGPYSSKAYLNLNNTVTVEGPYGSLEVVFPPQTPYLVVIANLNETVNFTVPSAYGVSLVGRGQARLNTTPPLFVCTNATMLKEAQTVMVEAPKGPSYITIAINSSCVADVQTLLKLNDYRVNEWLARSRAPPSLPSDLAREYFLSLLLIKDDQNPYLGTFAASPSPVYLYSWVRDSSFAAMALQSAGHYDSALKYWLWMASAETPQGTWYTRYNFYTGSPDESFSLPEYDSLGLFEIGVYDYYMKTRNLTFLDSIAAALNRTVSFQVSSILGSDLHVMPEDLSVWEDRVAYHFWTEAVNLIGLQRAEVLLSVLGYNVSAVSKAIALLNESINEYFWNGSIFYSAMVPYVTFTAGGKSFTLGPESPYLSSSSVLPLAIGSWPTERGSSDVNYVIKDLWNQKTGGLARFNGDDYHYNDYLYDSSAPTPPWVLTTLFLAYYYAVNNNASAALSLLSWSVNHSQNGLLPEAVDPTYGNPLPTTSPLTWSSAMYVLTVLSLRRPSSSTLSYAVIGGVIAALTLLTYAIQRSSARRLRGLKSPYS
jgi:hypothetical protein